MSPQSAHGLLPWDAQPAAKRDALESLDAFAETRNRLRFMAEHVGEWAGIPIGIDGEELVIEPSYKFAKVLAKKEPETRLEDEGIRIRNTFWSTRRSCQIMVYEKDGKIDWSFNPGVHHFDHDLRTLVCSFAWGIEQESNALNLLGTLVRHHTFKMYLLTGMFLESSPRSGVTYMFRKLKPTVALVKRKGKMRILTTLCMHPIAYYAGTWAGAMCPTDDVIAHLMMMRADEPMFWRRSNQHPAYRPEAGL